MRARYNISGSGIPGMGEVTVLVKASSKFESLRTTVPKGIVKQWNLKEGDKLEWQLVASGDEMAVVVKRFAGKADQKRSRAR